MVASSNVVPAGRRTLQSVNELPVSRLPRRKLALNEFSEDDQGRRAAAGVGAEFADAAEGLRNREGVRRYQISNRRREVTG